MLRHMFVFRHQSNGCLPVATSATRRYTRVLRTDILDSAWVDSIVMRPAKELFLLASEGLSPIPNTPSTCRYLAPTSGSKGASASVHSKELIAKPQMSHAVPSASLALMSSSDERNSLAKRTVFPRAIVSGRSSLVETCTICAK
eukprot:5724512-Prymnesium_polylepis.2